VCAHACILIQAEKDVIAAHEREGEEKNRLTRLNTMYKERYEELRKRFEETVTFLREELARQACVRCASS
jgi:hypothetical protein